MVFLLFSSGRGVRGRFWFMDARGAGCRLFLFLCVYKYIMGGRAVRKLKFC